MLSWAIQKDLVLTLWKDTRVRDGLRGVLQLGHFERPDLGWIVKTVFEDVSQASMTVNELREKISLATPNIVACCESLVPDLEKAEKMDSGRAIDLGRRFAAYQEAVIFSGLLKTLAERGEWSEIRNRTEDLLKIAETQAQEEESFVVSRASDVSKESVSWLWPGFIPYGKVSTMEGNGGLGKSTILLDIASKLSQGMEGPFWGEVPGSNGPIIIRRQTDPADTIIMSAEDAASDTIRPRLEAAGADLSRIHLVSGVSERVRTSTGTETIERGVALDRDVIRLENLIVKTGARLVVIDPIVAMLGAADFHREQDVRRVLKALARVAERRRCAIVTIRHLNKNTSGEILARGSGSIGFVSAVRVAMLVVKHPISEEDRVIAVYKTNLSKPPKPVLFRFRPDPTQVDVASIEYTGTSNRSIEDLMEGDRNE